MRAYILKTIDYGDHGKILKAYTETGPISMIARGAKKMESPLRHMTQSSMLIEADLAKGELPTLKEARLLDYFPAIKDDFDKSTVLQCVNELIYVNVGEDDHERLFDFLMRFIGRLLETDAPFELLALFELKFLWFLGAGIHLKDCHLCHTKADLCYDSREGALICVNCAKDPTRIYHGKEIPALLQYYYYADLAAFRPQRPDKTDMKIVLELTDALYAMHLGYKGRAKGILKSLL